MPTGDPPNGNNWLHQYGHVYIGDPIPQQDSAGNHPIHWIGNDGQLILGGIQHPPLINPYTITQAVAYVEPKDGDVRWNTSADRCEIYVGEAHAWVPLFSSQMLKELYGEVKSTLENKNSFEDRFRDIICEAEGISQEMTLEEKQTAYVEEMVARVRDLITKSLIEFSQANQKPYHGAIYSTSAGPLLNGNST